MRAPLREDSLRRSAAALLLLGGLALALALGSAALNLDAQNGHFGFLAGSGASRPELAAGAVGARLVVLIAAGAAWAVVLQAGSLILGLGLDGPLAVHTLAVGLGLVVAMLAAAAASSIVGPVAAGIFGGSVYVVAQAAVNLKAAADQGLIGTADAGVRILYYIVPRTITSPMIAGLQLRNEAGPAAPRVEINDNTVIVAGVGLGFGGVDARLVRAAGAALRRRPAPPPPELRPRIRRTAGRTATRASVRS